MGAQFMQMLRATIPAVSKAPILAGIHRHA